MLKQLTARCYYTPCDSETDRPCLGYVRGERLSLMVDGGSSPAHAKLLLDGVKALDCPAPNFVALTHSHWDHTFGACAVDAPVIACAETQKHLCAMQTWAWNIDAMEHRLTTGEDIAFCHQYMLKEYADTQTIRVRRADVVFDERLTLDLGGCTAELIRLDNSHAEDCVVVYMPDEKVVFLGDIAYEDLHHNPPCWHQSRFLRLRQALEAMDFEQAVSGHQLPMSREDLMARLDEALSDGEPVIP